MTRIKTIHSELEIQKEIIKELKKNRVIDQTAFYLDNGTTRYYDPNRTNMSTLHSGGKYDYAKIAQLLHGVITKSSGRGTKVAIVSLGCGSCQVDKEILQHLQKMGSDFSFFGVDSSMSMLYKAGSVLNDVTFKVSLICANLGTLSFRTELDSVIGDHDIYIYLFFGNTFGNLNQGYITDILKGILNPGDHLLLDIVGFETVTTQIQAKLFQRYKGYLDNPADADFYLGPLENFGVPVDHGRLVLKITEDSATQAQVFAFGFKVQTPLNFTLEGEEVGLSPNEYVDLYHVFIYDLSKLNKFLEIKKFKLEDQIIGDFHNQLLLQRQ